MKISAINYLNNQTSNLKAEKTFKTNGFKGSGTQSLQMPTKFNYPDILFAGSRKEKKQVLSRANAHLRHALRPMSDVRFYVQKTNEAVPEIYKSILEEESKVTTVIKEVYDILDKGFKDGFQIHTKQDGARVEFEVDKKEGQASKITMLEYDKDNNLIRETKAKGPSVELITTYDPETSNVIEVSHLKPKAIYKGVSPSIKGLNGEVAHHMKAIYDFSNPDNKSVLYGVEFSPEAYSVERDYKFNSRGVLEEMLFLHKENKNGSKETQIELKFNYSSSPVDLHPDVIKKGVKTDKDGNFKADEVVEMHFLGEYPVKISKDVEQNADGTRKADYVYMFSGGKLLMVKSNEEITKDEYKADRIYKFTRHGLDEYMEKCSMPKSNPKIKDYTCEKKIEF